MYDAVPIRLPVRVRSESRVRNRARAESAEATAGFITLTATRAFVSGLTARYTAPIPPVPSMPSIRYLPMFGVLRSSAASFGQAFQSGGYSAWQAGQYTQPSY